VRVAYLVGEYPRTSETFVADEIKWHVRNGIEVRVISLYPAKKHSAPSTNPLVVNVFKRRDTGLRQVLTGAAVAAAALLGDVRLWPILYRKGYGGPRDRLTILGLGRVLRGNRDLQQLDVLHCHFGHNGHYAAVLSDLGVLDVPIITTFHGYDVSAAITGGRTGRYNTLFELGRLFLPISEFWAEKLRALGCPPEKIKVHRMGIDCTLNAFRAQRERGATAPRLISVGRLIEKKAHIFTLRALAQLRERRPDIDFRFDIVGEGPDEAVLKAEAARLSLLDRVTFHGALPHDRTLALLNAASVFVLPSVTASDGDMEGIPVSIMEAMAQGLLVISTFHSGIPELVEPGKEGILVPERDAAALSEKIEWALTHEDQWDAFARSARSKVENEFNRETLNRRLSDLYASVTPAAPSRQF
jgi:colanic acid/amylovoran biosynthesis glycosyltransferase